MRFLTFNVLSDCPNKHTIGIVVIKFGGGEELVEPQKIGREIRTLYSDKSEQCRNFLPFFPFISGYVLYYTM
jgi:hypothetical protein